MEWLQRQIEMYNRLAAPALKTQELVSKALPKYKRILSDPYISQIINLERLVNNQAVLGFIYEKLELENVITVFPKNGWYMSVDVIDTINNDGFIKAVANKWSDEKVKDEYKTVIKEYVNCNISEIEQRILGIVPGERELILKEVFTLHKEKRYIASIPLALAQIDGISKKEFGVGFFSSTPYDKKEKKPSEQEMNYPGAEPRGIKRA